MGYLWWFIGFHLIVICFDYLYTKSSHQKSNRICLFSEYPTFEWKLSFLPGLLNYIVEHFILARYSIFGYKNNCKANLRILSSINATSLMLIILIAISLENENLQLFFSKNENGNETPNMSIFTGLFTLLVSTFVLERSLLHKKWEYLANLYNKRNELFFEDTRDIIEASLVLDIIEMEMWSHSSFNYLFENTLTKAYSFYKNEYPFKINKLLYAKNDLFLEKLTKNKALHFVEYYQQMLITNANIKKIKKDIYTTSPNKAS